MYLRVGEYCVSQFWLFSKTGKRKRGEVALKQKKDEGEKWRARNSPPFRVPSTPRVLARRQRNGGAGLDAEADGADPGAGHGGARGRGGRRLGLILLLRRRHLPQVQARPPLAPILPFPCARCLNCGLFVRYFVVESSFSMMCCKRHYLSC